MAKYQKYAEYKDSGVEWLDVIPSHWTSIAIKYLAFDKNSLFLDGDWIESKDISDSGIRYITTGNVGTGFYKEQGSGFITESTFYKLSCTEVYAGDILISRLNLPIGRACIVPDLNNRIVTSVDNVIFRPDEEYHPKFLVYLFSGKEYFQNTENIARGATMQRISRGLLGNIRVVIPSKNEQIQIANFLDHETAKIDTLIAKQEKLIELLKEKRQAVISHAVTKGLNPNVPMKDSGVEWLGEVPEHWKVSKLKYESEVVDCRNKTPEYFDDGDYFVVRTTNVKNQQLNFNGALYTDKKNFDIWTQRGIPPVGSILFTREAPTGEVCLVPEDLTFCMGQRMMNFIAHEKKYSDYLFDYLISDCLERYINSVSHGSTVTHLRVEQVENIPVLVPPQTEIKEIHLHILNIKNQFNKLEDKATQTIDLLKERRTALISAAVTGKIDVRNWQHQNQKNNNNTELSA